MNDESDIDRSVSFADYKYLKQSIEQSTTNLEASTVLDEKNQETNDLKSNFLSQNSTSFSESNIMKKISIKSSRSISVFNCILITSVIFI